ncbi:thioredoxin domain-containing protein 11-like isoform X2 [Limulus polyphemus]|uniref:Thioredoxin domain-containing protein 11-like isoform X2 n=1 Tax=Limulus polyphemus TaxID=6850 RepID=A0ABM1TNG4_LIMPO|nr:thioredoxin domain-containing protein 11-like isoform X2 [Limulus polyphemus]
MATTDEMEDDPVKLDEPRGDIKSCLFQMMNTYGRELCFILAVLFTALAALHNGSKENTLEDPDALLIGSGNTGPPRTRKASPPKKFFSQTSFVTDYYLGSMNHLVGLLSEKEVSFVMYYAPWDATCIESQKEFEAVARYFHSQIFFAAVNCWWPEGECRQKLQPDSYPVFIVYVRHSTNIYYKGLLVKHYMIAFLDNVLNPIKRCHHEKEILELQAQHEGVLVSYFDFKASPEPRGYKQFYMASLTALNIDPTRRLGFGIITTKKMALKLKVTFSSTVLLYLWNGTEMYPERNVNTMNILNWAFKSLQKAHLIKWVSPSQKKSRMLSEVMENFPTLVLFTPRNLVHGISPYYDLVREVVLDYYNCNSSIYVASVIQKLFQRRQQAEMDLKELREKCSIVLEEQPHNKNKINDEPGLQNSNTSEVQDDKVAQMVSAVQKQQCKSLEVALSYYDFGFPSTQFYGDFHLNFSGLGCRVNTTLKVLAMDTVQFHTFPQHLGIDIWKKQHQTAAMIFDKETHYLLKEELNKSTLMDFIANYTRGLLDRYLRSVVRETQACTMTCGTNSFCVHEVTTASFKRVIMNPNKDVLLFYYSSLCGFCKGAFHIYLTVARYFCGVSGIMFVRINGDENDLPWEFTVERYPTLIFFPAHRKAESVTFPPSLSLTTVNLLQFILTNAQHGVRWQAATVMCSKKCVKQNFLNSLVEIQHHYIEHRILLNQILLVQRKFDLLQLKSSRSGKKWKGLEEVHQNQILKSYLKHLVLSLREKRKTIAKVKNLQELLKNRLGFPLIDITHQDLKTFSLQNKTFYNRQLEVKKQAKTSRSSTNSGRYLRNEKKLKKDEL